MIRPRFPRRWLAAAMLVALAACSTPDTGTSGTTNQAPTSSFTATPASGEAPLTVAFDASASSDPDGSIVAYQWDFGDGTTGTGLTASHAYGVGSFTVVLTVTDDRNGTGQSSLVVEASGPPATGVISGTVTAGASAASSGVADGATHPAWSLESSTQRFVPGEAIVKFRSGVATQSLSTLEVDGLRLLRVSSVPVVGLHLFRASESTATETIALIRRLQARPDVLYAQPNYIHQALVAPDDEHYGLQWHYPAINMEEAWGLTTGDPNTVVAVVDSGILYRNGDVPNSHPDLAGKVLPGYDFISSDTTAADGDGRDADPFEPPAAGTESSFHGSHVAGTIAAATDNSVGVSGVNWQAKILPVRALGVGGGDLNDILHGILWAAGFEIAGVPTNAHPADVINLSLGGPSACDPATQDVLNQVSATAVVVVAAGNSNEDAWGFSPASCSGVITVGATEFAGARAPYSNYGTRIDVMAPGGDTAVDVSGDGFADGVLSLGVNDDVTAFDYRFLQGTSMAAPHVAGVVSLMRALEPDIDTPTALSALVSTSRPLSAIDCNRPSSEECGAGLIDVFAALTAVQQGTVPPPPPPDEGEPGPTGPNGPMVVAAFLEDASGDLIVSGSETSDGVITSFRFDALVGENIVSAWSDENANNAVDAGDYFGTYATTVTVLEGSETSGVALSISPVLGTGDLDAPESVLRRLEYAAAQRP